MTFTEEMIGIGRVEDHGYGEVYDHHQGLSFDSSWCWREAVAGADDWLIARVLGAQWCQSF